MKTAALHEGWRRRTMATVKIVAIRRMTQIVKCTCMTKIVTAVKAVRAKDENIADS